MVQESNPLKSFDDTTTAKFGRRAATDNSVLPDESVPGMSRRSPDEIRADMRKTRAQIDQTVDELQTQLRPSALLSRVGQSAQQVAGRGLLHALNAIKENPLPATVIGAGLLMMMTRRHGGDRVHHWPSGREATIRPDAALEPSTFERARDAVSHAATAVKEKAGGLTHDAADAIKTVSGAVGEKLHDASIGASQKVRTVSASAAGRAAHIGNQVSDGAKHSVAWVDEMVHEYPLAAGAACFALGLAGGFALPSCRKEDELLGPARDRVVREAQAVGADLIQKGEALAEFAVDATATAVKQTADSMSDSASPTDEIANSPTARNPQRGQEDTPSHRKF